MADDDIEVDVDEATLAIIQANEKEMQRLQSEAVQASGAEERNLIVEFIKCAKSQEAVLSELPGLEDRARKLGWLRAQAEDHYGL